MCTCHKLQSQRIVVLSRYCLLIIKFKFLNFTNVDPDYMSLLLFFLLLRRSFPTPPLRWRVEDQHLEDYVLLDLVQLLLSWSSESIYTNHITVISLSLRVRM